MEGIALCLYKILEGSSDNTIKSHANRLCDITWERGLLTKGNGMTLILLYKLILYVI